MSEYIAKASIEPRDYRVVFLIQKDRTGREFSGLYGLSNNICPLSGCSVFYEILIT